MFNRKKIIKSKEYENILKIKDEIEGNEDWDCVDSYHFYGGGSEEDIEYTSIYSNGKKSKILQFTINYYTKNASVEEIPFQKQKNKKKRFM